MKKDKLDQYIEEHDQWSLEKASQIQESIDDLNKLIEISFESLQSKVNKITTTTLIFYIITTLTSCAVILHCFSVF